jgi:uncharacterized protein
MTNHERIGNQLAREAQGRSRVKVLALALVFLAIVLPIAYGAQRYVRQREIIYAIPPLDAQAEKQAVTIAEDMKGWVINEGRQSAILYFSGNGEAVDTLRDEFVTLFPERTVYLVPYPGFPPNEGSIAEQNVIARSLKLYDSVVNKFETVGLVGRSMGTGVAIQVASQRKVDQMLLISPFDQLFNAESALVPLIPNRLTMKDKYDSIKLAPEIRMPTVFVIGEKDVNVTPRNSQRLAAAFGLPPTIVEVPGADHFSIVNTNEYRVAATAAFGISKADVNGS